MDGIECLTEIKKAARTKDIPVIVLSSDTHQINTVRSIGASGFIEKSYDWSGLSGKLKKVLDTDFHTNHKIANEVFLIL
jgi:DNA-binding NarL/FixJ family response regulator